MNKKIKYIEGRIILRARIIPRLLLFIFPFFLLLFVGTILNGKLFFSLQYWRNVDSVIINKYLGLAALVVFLLICLWKIFVLFYSKGIIILYDGGNLIFNGSTKVPIAMVDMNSIRAQGINRNRIHIGLKNNKSVSVSAIFVYDNGTDIVESVVRKINELELS